MYNEIDETEEMRQKNSQTTCYVIAYDIPDNKRRTKVHEILLGFGTWTQYSLFECFLSKRELLILQSKLDDYLIEAKDSVRFYPLCANCLERVETIGGPHHKKHSCLWSKLCRERLSDDTSERSLSHGSWRGPRAI